MVGCSLVSLHTRTNLGYSVQDQSFTPEKVVFPLAHNEIEAMTLS